MKKLMDEQKQKHFGAYVIRNQKVEVGIKCLTISVGSVT